MTNAAQPLPVGLGGPGTALIRTSDSAALTSREAALRSGATICLAGIALVQAIELPSVFAQGGQFVVVSVAAVVACIALGLALTAASAAAAGALWRLVAATAVVVLGAWALRHALALPGLQEDGYGGQAAAGALHRWASSPGAVCAALAIVCLLLAALAGRPTRPAARALATAVAVLVAVGPGVWVGLVALAPGVAGGEQSLAAGHVHSHAGHPANTVPEAISFRPGSGRAGGHFVVAVTPPARHTPFGLALVILAAATFTAASLGHLRGRTTPGPPVASAGTKEDDR